VCVYVCLDIVYNSANVQGFGSVAASYGCALLGLLFVQGLGNAAASFGYTLLNAIGIAVCAGYRNVAARYGRRALERGFGSAAASYGCTCVYCCLFIAVYSGFRKRGRVGGRDPYRNGGPCDCGI